MTSRNRVVWSEGLFLRPQHFQQLDRFIERLVHLRADPVRSHGWGFSDLKINRELLATGKIKIEEARGVFRDGTAFSAPDDDPLPPALDLSNLVRDVGVVLSIPVENTGVPAYSRSRAETDPSRLLIKTVDLRDSTPDSQEVATIEVAGVNTSLQLANGVGNDRMAIPLAHVLQVQTSGLVQLDETFMPTVLSIRAAPALESFVSELLGMLKQGADHLASLAVTSGKAHGDLREFLLLQVMNRWEPLLEHFQKERNVHPELLFQACIQLLGDLAALTEPTMQTRRPGMMPTYQHHDLKQTFTPLINRIRAALGTPMDHRTIMISLEIKKNRYWFGAVKERGRLTDSEFILAVSAEQPEAMLEQSVLKQVTVSAAERIISLVNSMRLGIALSPIQPPREIPFHRGYLYFRLDGRHPEWSHLNASAGIAVHVPETIPGPQLELWAIRR